jgi:hypothetical protein
MNPNKIQVSGPIETITHFGAGKPVFSGETRGWEKVLELSALMDDPDMRVKRTALGRSKIS